MVTADNLKGGPWLGAARSWLQRKKLNGSRVTWGSQETLEPPMTVRDVEDVAATAVEADRKRIEQLLERSILPPDQKALVLKLVQEGIYIQ